MGCSDYDRATFSIVKSLIVEACEGLRNNILMTIVGARDEFHKPVREPVTSWSKLPIGTNASL